MSDARDTLLPLLVIATLVAWLGYVASPARGQQRGPGPSSQRPEHGERGHAGHGGLPPGADHGPPSPLGRFLGSHLFRPLPEDEGPVTPEEQKQLMSFLRQNLPAFHQELKQLRRRDPLEFRKRLDEAAPRLRQLRRIFERDPELGRNVVRHAENLQRLHRIRRALESDDLDAEQYARMRDEARRTLAENLRIETAVLDDRALELEQQRDARSEAEYRRLMSSDADLAEEPPNVRELVGRLQSPQEGDDLAALEEELRGICTERVDQRVAHLRELAAKLRTNAVEEVDRRMKLFGGDEAGPPPLGPPDQRGGRHGGPKHGRRSGPQP